ncbi:hypothetical protein DLP3_016 [Stenotrophomonas phage vB_SmaS_DLP_3]|nr:hypothetical protein DLP3_016 [Stenotrophomonas phage vB_SmaS_DLP_3]
MLLEATVQVEKDEQRAMLNLLRGSQIAKTSDYKKFLKDHFGD